MERGNHNLNGRSTDEDNLMLEDVGPFIDKMNGLLEDLESNINQLPKVDKNGVSECHFAKDLYDQKDAAAAKVSAELTKMSSYLELLKTEIERCRHNNDAISSGANSVNLDQAKDGLEGAKRSQECEYDTAIEQQRLLADLNKRSHELLKRAREKKWPLEKDARKQVPVPPTATSRSSFDAEVDNLMSLPPLM